RDALGDGWLWKTALVMLGCASLVYWHITLFEGRPIYAQTLFWLASGGVLLGAAVFVNLTPPTPLSVYGEGGVPASMPDVSPSPFAERGQGGEVRIFLSLWLLLALAAAVWGVPFQAMRHLLYALPPIVLLLLPAVGERPNLLLTQGLLSLLVIAADYDYAIRYKRTANYYAQRFPNERVWYAGSWGWMFYAEQAGFRKLLPDGTGLQPGDIILVPQRVYKGKMPPDFERNARLVHERVCPLLLPLRTMDFEGAAYYALIRTNAPFRFTLDYATPLEVTRAYRWNPPR
ncbi:MAG: hypothetical protein N2651_04845, partial [Fimbriimonadales bacterium]|nr:hypothetical protein [Fimbriimonadales bacterium]